MSYTIDVYRKNLQPLSRLLDYAFYVSFFPQLVAGPIVRARDFIPQIRQPLMVTSEMFGKGLFLILSGLFKKAIIADYISINFMDRVFDNPLLYSGVVNWLAIYGYAMQIYCDFSGYSDIAIGLALILGYHFPDNFRSPYKAQNVSEFWRRWHISLSSWLKDYIYIALGGNRKGKFKTYRNLLLTMILGGLWHGAALNYIIWGGVHGIALVCHKWYIQIFQKITNRTTKQWRKAINTILTFHFICIAWLLFRTSSIQQAILMIKQIYTSLHPQILLPGITEYTLVAALIILGYALHYTPETLKTALCNLLNTASSRR